MQNALKVIFFCWGSGGCATLPKKNPSGTNVVEVLARWAENCYDLSMNEYVSTLEIWFNATDDKDATAVLEKFVDILKDHYRLVQIESQKPELL